MNKRIILLLMICSFSYQLRAQFYSAKTNLLGLTTTNINAEFSMTLNRRWSLHFPINYNPFVFGNNETNRQLRNLTFTPGVRYWSIQSYMGLFVGVNGFASRYHIGNLFDKYRYDGSAFGAGLSIGKAWVINRHWNFELEGGLGLVWADYNKYKCKKCGLKIDEYSTWKIIPMKFAANIVYLF